MNKQKWRRRMRRKRMLNKEMNTNFTNINMGMGMEMTVWLEIFELKYETKLSFAVIKQSMV